MTLQFGLLAAQNADGQGRLSRLFNFGWKFHAGDLKDAYSVNYDDSSWRVLDLPHDFQIEQPWDKGAGGARGFKAMGTGWYRKTFKADPEWKADGMDLQYVKVYAVDCKGRVVPATEGEVTFEVSGEARLIAVDNGDHMTDELFSGNHKKLHQGFVMAILRSSQTSGNVKIKASLKGLKSAEKKMMTK